MVKRETDWDDRLDLDGGQFPIADTERHAAYEAESLGIQLNGSTDNMNVLATIALKMMLTPQTLNFFGGGQVLLNSGSGDYKHFLPNCMGYC